MKQRKYTLTVKALYVEPVRGTNQFIGPPRTQARMPTARLTATTVIFPVIGNLPFLREHVFVRRELISMLCGEKGDNMSQ